MAALTIRNVDDATKAGIAHQSEATTASLYLDLS